MEIKITAGEYRGRMIRTPGAGTHPMGARERLALFNMISSWLPGAQVLDAYAGSGELGIEAISRGAVGVVFLEQSVAAARIIKENLVALGINGEVVTSDAAKFVPDREFDVILADPPYDDFSVDGVENLTKYLKNDGVLVLSHPGPAPDLQGLTLDRTRKYAGAHLSVYTK